jgi:hypothetical protein
MILPQPFYCCKELGRMGNNRNLQLQKNNTLIYITVRHLSIVVVICDWKLFVGYALY